MLVSVVIGAEVLAGVEVAGGAEVGGAVGVCDGAVAVVFPAAVFGVVSVAVFAQETSKITTSTLARKAVSILRDMLIPPFFSNPLMVPAG